MSDFSTLAYSHLLKNPGGSAGEEICLQCRRPGFDPWVGKIPWRRAWQPIPVFSPGKSPGTEEPGGLQSMRWQRVGHNWPTKHNSNNSRTSFLQQPVPLHHGFFFSGCRIIFMRINPLCKQTHNKKTMPCLFLHPISLFPFTTKLPRGVSRLAFPTSSPSILSWPTSPFTKVVLVKGAKDHSGAEAGVTSQTPLTRCLGRIRHSQSLSLWNPFCTYLLEHSCFLLCAHACSFPVSSAGPSIFLTGGNQASIFGLSPSLSTLQLHEVISGPIALNAMYKLRIPKCLPVQTSPWKLDSPNYLEINTPKMKLLTQAPL